MLEHPYVLFISGPSGSGKSTAAHAWASSRNHPCAQISLDAIRIQLKSGFADPLDGWGPETDSQFRLARSAAAMMARKYLAADISCVIDDSVFPEWPGVDLQGWVEDLSSGCCQSGVDTVQVKLVVLMPCFPTVLNRNSERQACIGEPMLRKVYRMMMPWIYQESTPVLNTCGQSVEDTVDAIDDALHARSGHLVNHSTRHPITCSVCQPHGQMQARIPAMQETA